MKKVILGAALAAACSYSFADWTPTFIGGQYTSTVTTGAFGQTPQSISTIERMSSSGGAAGPIGSFAEMALTLQPKLKADLDHASAATVPAGTSFSSGVMTGGLQVYMAAPSSGGTGVNFVNISGPTYTATYSTSGTKYGIHYTCTLRATMANLQITGSYNVAASTLDASQTKITFTPQSNASCSTAIDWIPGLGDWADRIATGQANNTTLTDLSAFQGQTLQSVLPGAPQFVGFNATIPNGVFVFGGQDMGQFIKYNAPTLLGAPGATVNMTIGAPQVEGPFVSGVSLNVPMTYANTEFTISFGSYAGNLSYKIASERSFDYTYSCPRGTVRCIEP
jgi:hypothetical protein